MANDWTKDLSRLEKWLEDHRVPNPGRLNTEQARDLVAKNYEKAYESW
jgi:hypothetical protein